MTFGIISVVVLAVGILFLAMSFIEHTAWRMAMGIVIVAVVSALVVWFYSRGRQSLAINVPAEARAMGLSLDTNKLLIVWRSRVQDERVFSDVQTLLRQHGSPDVVATSRSSSKQDWHTIWRCSMLISKMTDRDKVKAAVRDKLASEALNDFAFTVVDERDIEGMAAEK